MYTFHYQPSPRNTLLDLMGVHPEHQLATGLLGVISDAFDLSVNNLRVTLNRLASADLVRSDERGVYTLTEKALAKRSFMNRWKASALTTPEWNGNWLACHLPKGEERGARKKTCQALELNGFKGGLDQLWVRPDNLTTPLPELRQRLMGLGLEGGANCFVIQAIEDRVASQWVADLWPVATLDREYEELISLLQQSEDELTGKSPGASLAETCRLGGEAIYRLAIDPLLPRAIRPGDCYEKLQESARRYDRIGREIWLEQLQKLGVNA
jgi:phenylacetic acid degradation operon negative regulatory protein